MAEKKAERQAEKEAAKAEKQAEKEAAKAEKEAAKAEKQAAKEAAKAEKKGADDMAKSESTKDSWTVVWSNGAFSMPVEEVISRAHNASHIWVRSVDDTAYGAITKPNSWPLECLRAGKAFSKPLEGGDATKARIAEAWEGSPMVLEHLWSHKVPEH